jgi:hypothetical protein
MEGGIEGAVLNLKHIIRGRLYVFRDLMTVRWSKEKCAQYEHVESAWQQFTSIRLSLGHDG